MSIHDDARAASEAVYDAALSGLEAQVSSLSGQLAVSESRLTSVESELTAVRAEYAQYVKDHPDVPAPKPTAAVFGATPGQWPIPGAPRVPVLRDYLGPGDKPTTFPASWTDRTTDGGVIWFSWKVDDPAWLDRFLATKPANRVLIGTFRHEPENDVKLALTDPAKQADIQSYQAAWARALPVLRKHGVLSAVCLLGDRVAGGKRAENEAYWVEGVDLAGFDRYNPGLGNATTYVDPVKVFAPVLQFARDKGKPLAIGETGTIVVPGSTAVDRAEWARRVRDHLAAQPDVPYVCWWNQSKMTIDQPVSDAWFA